MAKRSMEKICRDAFKLGQVARGTKPTGPRGRDITWALEGLKGEAGKKWREVGRYFVKGVNAPKKKARRR